MLPWAAAYPYPTVLSYTKKGAPSLALHSLVLVVLAVRLGSPLEFTHSSPSITLDRCPLPSHSPSAPSSGAFGFAGLLSIPSFHRLVAILVFLRYLVSASAPMLV